MSFELIMILLAWCVAGASPGPATLAISSTSITYGRRAGLVVAAGIVAGSASWGVAAALGMSAVMMSNIWVLETIRFAGVCYLLYLAYKAFRRGLSGSAPLHDVKLTSTSRLWWSGFLIHITNPKAILAWGAVFSIVLPSSAAPNEVWGLYAKLISVSSIVFFGYAILFSTQKIVRGYVAARRWFEFGFAALFGVASLQILTARLTG